MATFRTALVSFLAASVVPPLLFALFTPLSDELNLASAAGTFLVTYQFSLVAMLFLGIPTFFLFRRFNFTSWGLVVAAGVVDGALVAILLRLPNQPDLRDVVQLAVIGAAATITFRTVWALQSRRLASGL